MNRLLSRSCSGVLVLGAGLLFLAGCSRPVGTVSGKVTYMNKPLKGGSVVFSSTEGRQSFSGEIQEDGSYTVNNVVGGEYKVCVDTSYLQPPNSGPGGPGMGSSKGGSGPPPRKETAVPKNAAPPKDAVVPEGYKGSSPADARIAANAKKYVQIPDSYKSPDKTDLTYTATGGSQTFDIQLK